MSTDPDDPGNGPQEPDAPSAPGARDQPETVGEPAHDRAGLELARAIARAYQSSGGKGRGQGAPGPRSAGRRRRRAWGPGAVSGAHPDDRDPQPLDVTIDKLVVEHGWRADVAVHGVFGRWDTIVGPELAQHCRPESWTDGILVVGADSTAWATSLTLLAGTVVARLNEDLGHGTVTRVDVHGPQTPSWRRGPRTVRGRGPRDTYG
ncbi:MAG: DUF721 domain-containing protein [Nocardioidaceae bacterium]